jgi:Ca-activated chloride channel family protein
VLVLLVVGLFVVIALCCGASTLLNRLVGGDGERPTAEQPAGSLTVAYSPEKAATFRTLVDRFNAQGFKSPDGQPLSVAAVEVSPEQMIQQIIDETATYQAITPDSSLWLGQLDQGWNVKHGTPNQQSTIVGETVRYAVSPVVIAMWEGVAREMGWPDRSIGWRDLLNKAQTDSTFRWSHPSTGSASGMLATLAMFYAGAGKTRGLTIDDAQSQATLDYVAALENTVVFYGEGDEPALIEQALQKGRDFLDAFVVQEQMVVNYNTRRNASQERLVAVYPSEGVLWEDHPLALLETSGLTALQRQTFESFRDFLLSTESQQYVLSNGYRPADYAISLTGPDSPLTAENGVDQAEPKTALQVPNAAVVQVVHDVWWYTKRHTNLYLVVDTSGSMRGEKLAQAQEALGVFLQQIQGDLERVGMVQFSSQVNDVMPLNELGTNRTDLQAAVNGLQAGGDTALLDAIATAYSRLQTEGDPDRINAIVAMTDGQENNSMTSLDQLVRVIQYEGRVKIVIFCVAYGSDADMGMLQAIAEPTGGKVYRGDPETIRELYKIISTYF